MGYTDEETIKNNCLHKYYHIDPKNLDLKCNFMISNKAKSLSSAGI